MIALESYEYIMLRNEYLNFMFGVFLVVHQMVMNCTVPVTISFDLLGAPEDYISP